MPVVPPKGFLDTTLEKFLLKGRRLAARLETAVTAATIERTMDGASTLVLTLKDDKRELLRSNVLAERAVAELDGLKFEIVGLSKQGSELQSTLESEPIARLRRKKGPRVARRGTTTRTQFARQLVTSAGLKFRGETSETYRGILAVGTDAEPKELYWDALRRLAEERKWRCFEAEEVIYFGSDKWLVSLKDPFVLSEEDEGIDLIDFEYDGGKRASRATVHCWANRWASRPGDPVKLDKMGKLASGIWLVSSITRSLFTKQTAVELVRKTPALSEAAAAAASVGQVGGIGIGTAPGSFPVTGTGTFRTCPVPGGSISNDFGAPRVGHTHQGNDIFAPLDTPIVAPFDGVVTQVPNSLGGNAIRLSGPEGYVYVAHLNRYGATGQVSAGEVIGYVGNTGNATGTSPHAHFEWHPGGGAAVDPYALLTGACGA